MPGRRHNSQAIPTAKPATGPTGKAAYEARRAAQAGMSVEKWREARARAQREEQAAIEAARPKVAKPPGFFKRLLDRAHKPL